MGAFFRSKESIKSLKLITLMCSPYTILIYASKGKFNKYGNKRFKVCQFNSWNAHILSLELWVQQRIVLARNLQTPNTSFFSISKFSIRTCFPIHIGFFCYLIWAYQDLHFDIFKLLFSWDIDQMSHLLMSSRWSYIFSYYNVGKKTVKGINFCVMLDKSASERLVLLNCFRVNML